MRRLLPVAPDPRDFLAAVLRAGLPGDVEHATVLTTHSLLRGIAQRANTIPVSSFSAHAS
jgi:hypothetical protein